MMSSDEYAVISAVAGSRSGGFLTTIIDVTGSAYRKEGTMMFFSEDNWETGLLSGGCVEQDILARIKNEDDSKSSSSVVYDLRSEDDLSWGQGAGCDGSITVLIEYVDSVLIRNLSLVKKWLDNGYTVDHLKVLDHDLNLISTVFISETGEIAGSGDTDIIHSITVKKLQSDKHNRMYYFRQSFTPQPRLIIYGAGPDARPVCDIAKLAGFKVLVGDWRPAYCTKEDFPRADILVVANPVVMLEEMNAGSKDFIVIMTHNFTKDKELLEYLLVKKYAFVGMLGSKKRADRLFNGKEKPDWFHSPVSFNIHADGPEQIAISIAAQLIAVKNSTVLTPQKVKK